MPAVLFRPKPSLKTHWINKNKLKRNGSMRLSAQIWLNYSHWRTTNCATEMQIPCKRNPSRRGPERSLLHVNQRQTKPKSTKSVNERHQTSKRSVRTPRVSDWNNYFRRGEYKLSNSVFACAKQGQTNCCGRVVGCGLIQKSTVRDSWLLFKSSGLVSIKCVNEIPII